MGWDSEDVVQRPRGQLITMNQETPRPMSALMSRDHRRRLNVSAVYSHPLWSLSQSVSHPLILSLTAIAAAGQFIACMLLTALQKLLTPPLILNHQEQKKKKKKKKSKNKTTALL